MRKALSAVVLFLLLAGCLPMTAPSGAKGGAEVESKSGGTDDIAVNDSPAAPPAVAPVAPPPPATEGGSPEDAKATARFFNGDVTNPTDTYLRQQPAVAAGPGPIDPKAEVAEAVPRHCQFDRLLYGPTFSNIIRCDFIPPDMELPEDGDFYDLRLRLEHNLAERKVVSGIELKMGPDQWVPQADGYQVRLVYKPVEGSDECSSLEYVDAVTAASSDPNDPSNLLFSKLERKAGLLRFFLFKNGGRSDDFQTAGLKKFDGQEGCVWPLGDDDFDFIGYLKMVDSQVHFLKPKLNWTHFPALTEPESQPIDRLHMIRMLKEIDLSQP